MRLAFIGYGEVTHNFGLGLIEAGWPAERVMAYYPQARSRSAAVEAMAAQSGIRLVREADALTGAADLYLSAVTPATALEVASDLLPRLSAGAVFADINSTSAAVKRQMGALAAARGVAMADIALYGAATIYRHTARMKASGPGAEEYAAAFNALGGQVEVIGAEPGMAAQLKMLRSTALKGFAMVVAECMAAAKAADLTDAMLAELVETVEALPFARQIDRWMTGSVEHAGRRVGEMEFVLETLSSLGVNAPMSEATKGALSRIADGGSIKSPGFAESVARIHQVWNQQGVKA